MGEIPRLSGDLRPLIPTLGLRNYWYPAVRAGKVGWRSPLKVSLLGEDLFDDPDGNGLEAYYELPRAEWNRERPFTEAGPKGRFPGPWDEALRR